MLRFTMELMTACTFAVADASSWFSLQLLRALSLSRRARSRRPRQTPTGTRSRTSTAAARPAQRTSITARPEAQEDTAAFGSGSPA